MLQRIKDLMSFKETALCCGRLVLQKRKDLLSFYNGPAFAVLVKFRIACFRLLHYWRTTTRWPRNAERSKDTGRQLLQARCNQSRGTSLKDNTQTKLRSDSANVTASFLITNTKILSCGDHTTWYCCDRESRAACAQSFAPWQQATIEIMLVISLTIACSRYVFNGVILHAYPVRGESHNQRNATGEVATVLNLILFVVNL